jgi:WD40 repeat protein
MRTNPFARSLLVLGLAGLASACREETSPLSPVVSTLPSLAKGGPNALPTNGRIYFTSNFAGNYDVYSMKLDGTDRRRLTLTSDNEAYMNVSRDGKKLVLGTFRPNAEGAELVTMNVDGSNRRVIVSDAAANTVFKYPAFSPDGRTIAYVSNVGDPQNPYSIWTVPASGGKATRLTPLTSTATFPSWSPDGTQIVYSSGPQGSLGKDLYVMGADGSAPQLLTACADSCLNPVWSPDGSQIVYIEFTNSGLTIRSCYPQQIPAQCGNSIAHSGYPSSLALSPDGSQLVYAAIDVNNLQVHRVFTSNVNGSGQAAVTADLYTVAAVAWGR